MERVALPELPIKHKHDEADFGLRFRKWILNRKQKMPEGEYELKDSRGKNSIPFKEITEDQIDSALRSESDKGNLVRIIVGSLGAADYSYHRNRTTFFVINYPKSFEIVPLQNLLLEKSRSKRKSLTALRAKEISIVSVGTKKEAI